MPYVLHNVRIWGFVNVCGINLCAFKNATNRRHAFAAGDVIFDVTISYPGLYVFHLGDLLLRCVLFRDTLVTNKLTSHLVYSRRQKQSHHLSKKVIEAVFTVFSQVGVRQVIGE